MKCRGREYLRIIYGPEYTSEANLGRLRSRGLGRQAVAGPGRVRAGDRGAGTLRPRGAAAAGPRVRLRGPGPGERAGGPETLRSCWYGEQETANKGPQSRRMSRATTQERRNLFTKYTKIHETNFKIIKLQSLPDRILTFLAVVLIIKVTTSVVSNYHDYFPPNFTSDFLRGREGHFLGAFDGRSTRTSCRAPFR